MARLLTEGFEHGTWTYLPTGWTVSGTTSITADAKAWGYGSYSLSVAATQVGLGTSQSYALYSFGSTSEIYFRLSIKRVSSSPNTTQVFSIRDSANGQVAAIYNTSGSFYLARGSTNVLDLGAMDTGWHTYEFRVKNTSGSYVLTFKLDGSQLYSYSDSTPLGAANVNNFVLWATASGGNGTTASLRFDDIAINDTTGGVDNSWMGEGSVVALLPNGNGDSSEWMGSDSNQTDNYLLVDDRPPDGDTTYVWTKVSGDIDLYAATSPTVTAGDSIGRVWAGASVRKEGVSGMTYLPGLKTGTTEVWSATARTPNTAYTTHQVMDNPQLINPDSGLAWTQSDLDNLQIGIQSVI